VADLRLADDIARGAERHGYLYERSPRTGGRLIMQLPELSEESLLQLPVCWRDSVIQQAKSRNVPLVLRPSGTEFLGPGGLHQTLGFCHEQPMLLFQGKQVLGYPNDLDTVARLLQERQQFYAWLEFDDQDGGAALAMRMAPRVVRVHSIPAEELGSFDITMAVQRLFRAVNERSIRVLYLRAFGSGALLTSKDAKALDPKGQLGYREKLQQLNAQYFARVGEMLALGGFRLSSRLVPPADPPAWLKTVRLFCFMLAKSAAFLLLLGLLLPGWPRWAYNALLALVVFKSLLVLTVPDLLPLFALEAAVVFPLLGFWVALTLYQRLGHDRPAWCPRRWLAALAALLIASLTSAAGGLLIHGTLWSANTILHVGQFRGVTIALALPVLVFAAYAWQAESLHNAWDRVGLRLTDYWQRFSGLWQAPIRYGDVAFILIALGALGIVLLRSGNEGGLPVLDSETLLRGALEQTLVVRPRTKELIGHPLLVLFLLSLPWRNRLTLLLGLAALLGQVSILNTFCHLHTPLAVTLQRVGYGLTIGLVTGAVVGAVALAGAWVIEGLRAKLSSQPQ
jgi:hypothetical protein